MKLYCMLIVATHFTTANNVSAVIKFL